MYRVMIVQKLSIGICNIECYKMLLKSFGCKTHCWDANFEKVSFQSWIKSLKSIANSVCYESSKCLKKSKCLNSLNCLKSMNSLNISKSFNKSNCSNIWYSLNCSNIFDNCEFSVHSVNCVSCLSCSNNSEKHESSKSSYTEADLELSELLKQFEQRRIRIELQNFLKFPKTQLTDTNRPDRMITESRFPIGSPSWSSILHILRFYLILIEPNN